MKEILRVVRGVRRRRALNRFLAYFLDAAFFAAILLTTAVVVVKLVFFPNALAYLALSGLLLLISSVAYGAARSRIDMLHAALSADEGLALSERLSSALAFAADKGAMARAVVEDARAKARRVQNLRNFPVTLPEHSWRSAAGVVALAVALALPQFDVFGRKALHRARARERAEVSEQVVKAMRRLEEFKKTADKGDVDTMELLDALEAKLTDIEKQGLGKKEALAAISETLEELAERMKQAARDLAKKGGEGTKGLSPLDREAMKSAAEQLAKMKDALEQGQMSPQEKAEVAENLQELAKALAEKAEAAQKQMEKLQEQLAETGLSKEEQERLTEAMQQLAQQAQQNQQLSEMLAQAAAQMGAGQASQALAQMQSALSGMEGMLAGAGAADQISDMANALAGLDAFNEGLTGEGSLSMQEAIDALARLANMVGEGGYGPGMGNRGIGEGNEWEVSDVETDVQTARLPGEMRKGRVLAGFFTEGGQLKNESKVEYEEVVLESAERAKGALGTPRIPRAYRNTVRNYFDSLRRPASAEGDS